MSVCVHVRAHVGLQRVEHDRVTFTFTFHFSGIKSMFLMSSGASLIAQLVKNLPAMQETPDRFLGWVDLLEKG